MVAIKSLYLLMDKYSIILIVFLLLLGCTEKKCNGFYFSDTILESVPKTGNRYDLGFDNTLQVEVTEVVIDSTDYAITTPLNYQECESVIIVSYAIEDYIMTVRLSKIEKENNLFCSISGINLSKDVEFTNEDEFLKSKYLVYRRNDMNDTIMSIQMKGLKIEKITQKQ
jgi:hypothetical protein